MPLTPDGHALWGAPVARVRSLAQAAALAPGTNRAIGSLRPVTAGRRAGGAFPGLRGATAQEKRSKTAAITRLKFRGNCAVTAVTAGVIGTSGDLLLLPTAGVVATVRSAPSRCRPSRRRRSGAWRQRSARPYRRGGPFACAKEAPRDTGSRARVLRVETRSRETGTGCHASCSQDGLCQPALGQATQAWRQQKPGRPGSVVYRRGRGMLDRRRDRRWSGEVGSR